MVPDPRAPETLRVAPDGGAALARLVGRAGAALHARLAAAGHLLLRGAGSFDPAGLPDLLAGLGLRPRAYGEGLARRAPIAPGVYTAVTADAASPLDLHAELAHTTAPPDVLVFVCLTPAAQGGETLLADGEAIPAALGARWEAWRTRVLAYHTCRPLEGGPLALGRSWPEVYGTRDRVAVEALLAEEGVSPRWGEDGALHTRREGAVAREGRWYNHLLLWHPTALGPRGRRLRARLPPDRLPHDATWADGAPIPDADVEDVRARVEALAVPVAWEPGDVLIVDNLRTLHGRRPYRGERRLAVSLCDRA